MKLEKTVYKEGDLLYWNDFWCSTCGIGLFLNYVKSLNTKDISINDNKYYSNNSWVNILICTDGFIESRVFPPTSTCLQSTFKSIEEFDKYVKNFRSK